MISHHPAKFNGHKHCDSGDMTFLMVERQLLFISEAHGMRCSHTQNVNDVNTIICQCVQ